MEEKLLNDTLNESLYINTLPSGLKCYIMPKKDFVEKQALIAVNYGSVDTDFTVGEASFKTPDGVAHFLEHKMFEDKDMNIFDSFTALGADVNAYTNYNTTAYHFNCIDNFEKSLELLLRMVSNPHFTEENVEKEKGIIIQEIHMYRDYPSWRVFFNMQQGLYQRLKLNKDIAGTDESVGAIDVQTLYDCYNAFYRPDNMCLICSGDIDRETVYRIANQFLHKREGQAASAHLPEEPSQAAARLTEEVMAISRPAFNMGFKDNDNELDPGDRMIATKILVDMLFGESADFYERNYKAGLLDNSFSAEYVCGPGYGTSILSGYSKEPKKLQDAVYQEIANMIKRGVDEARFHRICRKHMGKYVKSFNAIDTITGIQADLFNKGLHGFDLMERFHRMNPDMIYDRLVRHLREESSSLSVIYPEKA